MKESIEPDVHRISRGFRAHLIVLDADLARIYGVPTFRLNDAFKRNRRRFPEDFLFQLTAEEHAALTSQIAMSKPGRGGRRTRPYAFTEHGALQVANGLNSSKAEAISIYVIHAFIRMREEVTPNQAGSKRLAEVKRNLLTNDAG